MESDKSSIIDEEESSDSDLSSNSVLNYDSDWSEAYAMLNQEEEKDISTESLN
jgi:hypothetical protein